jgi:hypothetical protein
MKKDRERVKLEQTLETLELDFLKRKRIYEEQEKDLMYGCVQTNQLFDDLADSTVYYLRKFEVEDYEFRSAMSIIEENKEKLLVEIKQEQRRRESVYEEQNYTYQKQRNELEDKLFSIRSE